ncbi:hypothetical protein RhiJN_19761 [Ceratobasidium sp. AG-Ba]|nr:hypothetical protein RhiJN_04930 [Ceratobasidium sp. AG-Ba]QRV91743.1 hypothetical protein RhiJN_19761 [Ceratobasidium sp. AG-Ba]
MSSTTVSTTPDSSSTPASSGAVTRQLILDSGVCGGFGYPKAVDTSDGNELEVTYLDGTRWGVSLTPRLLTNGAVNISLVEDGRGVGVRTTILVNFDSDVTTISIASLDGNGIVAYPFSLWLEGGELLGGSPIDSEEHRYLCSNIFEADCLLSSGSANKPKRIASSSVPGSVYITFCPPDGPALSFPKMTTIRDYRTDALLSKTTVIPVSTFLIPTEPTEGRKLEVTLTPTPVPISTTSGLDREVDRSLCPTATGSACAGPHTDIVAGRPTVVTETTSFEVTTAPGLSVLPSTYFDLEITTVIPITIFPTPTTPLEPKNGQLGSTNVPGASNSPFIGFPTTITNPLGSPVLTLAIPATAIPTFSAVTNSQGSVTNVAYNLTTVIPAPSPTPPPETFYTLTSWTTYSVENGSTIPLIGGQVGILSTIRATYVLQPSTTILLEDFSSISDESTQTSLPSATAEAIESAGAGPTRQSKLVGIIIGSVVVGLALFSLVFWTMCFRRKSRKRQQRRRAGSLARRSRAGSSAPGSRLGLTPDSRDGSTLDLNGPARSRESVVEPWVVVHQVPTTSRKMQREMEGLSGLVTAGSSRNGQRATVAEGSSVGRTRDTQRAAKGTGLPTLESAPIRNNTLSSILSTEEYVPISIHLNPNLVSEAAQSSTQLPLLSVPIHQLDPDQSVEGDSQLRAIPPRYNEAWNVPRPTLGQ